MIPYTHRASTALWRSGGLFPILAHPHIAHMRAFLAALRAFCRRLDYYVQRWFRLTGSGPFRHALYMQRVLLPGLAALRESWEMATRTLDSYEVMELVEMHAWVRMLERDVECLRREAAVAEKGDWEKMEMLGLGVCAGCGAPMA